MHFGIYALRLAVWQLGLACEDNCVFLFLKHLQLFYACRKKKLYLVHKDKKERTRFVT